MSFIFLWQLSWFSHSSFIIYVARLTKRSDPGLEFDIFPLIDPNMNRESKPTVSNLISNNDDGMCYLPIKMGNDCSDKENGNRRLNATQKSYNTIVEYFEVNNLRFCKEDVIHKKRKRTR